MVTFTISVIALILSAVTLFLTIGIALKGAKDIARLENQSPKQAVDDVARMEKRFRELEGHWDAMYGKFRSQLGRLDNLKRKDRQETTGEEEEARGPITAEDVWRQWKGGHG